MKTNPDLPPKSLTGLLIILMTMFFISPFLRGAFEANIFFKIIFSGLGIACVYLVSQKRLQTILAIILTLPGIFMTLSTDSFTYSGMEVLGLLSSILLYVLIIYDIFNYLKNQTTINMHIISGAISIYLLLGLIWSLIYMLIELNFPHSFNGIYDDTIIEPNSLSNVFNHLFYYSYVTITTLGYGSISPRTVLASAFSSAEAIVGQLYVAVFIARLVGLYTAEELRRKG